MPEAASGGEIYVNVLLMVGMPIVILCFVAKNFYHFRLSEECTGLVMGRYVYCEWVADVNGRGKIRSKTKLEEYE